VSSSRWLIAAGLVLALVIGGSIAAGSTRRGETEFPPDSPEGAVQRYVRALEAEDALAIRETLSPAAQQRCEISDIRNAMRYPDERDLRVTLRDSRITGDRAEVKVRVTENSGSGPFDSGSYDHEETFDLVRIEARWLIDQPTWPVYCPPLGAPRGIAPAIPPPGVPPPASTATPASPTGPTPAATAAPANR
jgi:hypothetical protein